MARQFKASTFFNKYFPQYLVQYKIENNWNYHYFYEFTDNMVDQSVIDFCESRMLVAIYSLISIYENKLITPSGKVVDLNDFSSSGLKFLKNISYTYFYSSSYFKANREQEIIKFLSDALDDNALDDSITYDEFTNFDFYSKKLLHDEIINRAYFIMKNFDNNSKKVIDFILNFEYGKNTDYILLAQYCDVLIHNNSMTQPISDKMVLEDDNSDEVLVKDLLIELDKLDLNITTNLDKSHFLNQISHLNFNDEPLNTIKSETSYSVNFDNLKKYLYFSEDLINNVYDFTLFKKIDQTKKKISLLTCLFNDTLTSLKPPSPESLLKFNTINAFKDHFDLYSYEEAKLRNETLNKMDSNYDLNNGVKIFKTYPYSPKNFENQAYIPLMIKAPIKVILNSMIIEIEKLVDDFPHFNKVIDYIVLTLKTRLNTNNILGFKHILIVGNHGVGKNAFVRRLNQILGYTGNTLNMNSIMAPFELAGMDAGWNGSAPGFFFKSILKNDAANTVLILDDIDKVNITHHGNINNCIIDLLEPESAKCYYENFFQTNIDMSKITVIGLANTIDNVDRGLLDLCKVFTINSPEVSDIGPIAFSIYKELKQDDLYSHIHLDSNELNQIVAKFIMSKVLSPRSIRKVIEESMNLKLIEVYNMNNSALNNIDKRQKNIENQFFNKEK